MSENSLDRFIRRTRESWGPLSSELVEGCLLGLEQLARARPDEPWLAALHGDAPATRELHRDAAHGFVLLAHTEQAGTYRRPHDHGRSWVIYALQRGEIAMSTYGRIETAEGPRLVKRDTTTLRAGQAQLFLPGDVHDTRCLAGPATLLRFTERDLAREDAIEHRLTRYVERDGSWTVAP